MTTFPTINAPTLSAVFESDAHRSQLEAAILPFVLRQRWYASKTTELHSITVQDSIPITGIVVCHRPIECEFVLLKVSTQGGNTDCYALPLMTDSPVTEELLPDLMFELSSKLFSSLTEEERADLAAAPPSDLGEELKGAEIATLAFTDSSTSSTRMIYECSNSGRFWLAFTTALIDSDLTSRHGRTLHLRRSSISRIARTIQAWGPWRFNVHGEEQSNTSVAIGNDFFLKLFRRPNVGHNPDAEVGSFLTDQTSFRHSPRVDGTILLDGTDGERCLALISEQIPEFNLSAWEYTLTSIVDFWARLAGPENQTVGPPDITMISTSSGEDPSQSSDSILGAFAQDIDLIGKRTAQLHAALSSCTSIPAFIPEPLTREYFDQLILRVSGELSDTTELLRRRCHTENRNDDFVNVLFAKANERIGQISEFDPSTANVVNIRCHGDYHLGQVLRTDSDFVILDFEGEPDRPFDERREKHSALKDVAGMVRSLHYASCASVVGMLTPPQHMVESLEEWQASWFRLASHRFLVSYEEQARGCSFCPQDSETFQQLLDLFLIEKVLYELRYEINNRPDWVQIPLAGLSAVLGLKV